MDAHPHELWQWAIGLTLFLAGALLLRRFWPVARAAWQAQVAAIQV